MMVGDKVGGEVNILEVVGCAIAALKDRIT